MANIGNFRKILYRCLALVKSIFYSKKSTEVNASILRKHLDNVRIAAHLDIPESRN